MGSIRLIQDFIEDELADRRAYLAYAACAPNTAARRLLRQLAGEEGSHARRLMGVYYLVTGCCYQPRLQGGRVERLPWREVLRTRYHAETCGGHGGRVSAGDMGGAVGGGISPCPAAAEPVGADGACIVRRMVLSYGKHQQQRRISHERAHQPGGGVGRPAEV